MNPNLLKDPEFIAEVERLEKDFLDRKEYEYVRQKYDVGQNHSPLIRARFILGAGLFTGFAIATFFPLFVTLATGHPPFIRTMIILGSISAVTGCILACYVPRRAVWKRLSK